MLIMAIITAIILFVAIAAVMRRARRFIHTHPEVLFNIPPLAYRRCHITLNQIVERYQQIETQVSGHTLLGWHAPGGLLYMVGSSGVRKRRDISTDRDLYALSWDQIGGVGVRMQPGFKLVDLDGDGSADKQLTDRYSFHLLIVPISGATMDIVIPTDDRDDAINFAAHMIALAEHYDKRINVFGFNKPPAPHHQRLSRFR